MVKNNIIFEGKESIGAKNSTKQIETDYIKKSKWVWSLLDVYLEKNFLKKTTPRIIIADYFIKIKEGEHVGVEKVYKDLNDNLDHKIALATVYRFINLMVEAKVLIQHNFHNLNSVFELAYYNHHDHLVCLDCGKIKEFEDETIEKKQISIAKNLGFSLKSHKLELFGNCVLKDCNEKQNQNINS